MLDEKQWQLLKDAKKVMDMSLAGLRRLYLLFFEAVKSPEQSLVGPSTFRMVVQRYGIRDTVLLKRLFCEWCEDTDRINYRDFMRVLISVNTEPMEDRLGLLFEIWDLDQSLSLSYSEMSGIMCSGVPAIELEQVTEQFNRVWADMRNTLQTTDDWMGPSRASGLSKEDLTGACQKMPHVKDFFDNMLTRRAPSVGESVHTDFAVRLRELEAEVLKESRAEEKELEHAQSSQSLGHGQSKPRLGRASSSMIRSPKEWEKEGLQPTQLNKYKQQVADRLGNSISGSGHAAPLGK